MRTNPHEQRNLYTTPKSVLF